MASDISLAVGDGARRMTYAEIADIRRTSIPSAMRLVRRKHWPRQTGNDGVVRVLVPLSAAGDRQQRRALARGQTSVDKRNVRRDRLRTSDRTSDPDKQRTDKVLETAVRTLTDQLDIANRRIDELLHQLADARTAALITGCEAAALRAENALLKARPRWKRWLSGW
jgi:hypothetical protein